MKPLEKLYELVFNTANYGITVTDHQHLLLTANAHFCKITGYDKDALEGQSVIRMLPPKIRPKVEAMYRDVAEGIVHPERIIKVSSKAGRPLVLSLSIQYVLEGEDHYFISSFKSVDASDRYVNLFKETEKAAQIGGWEIDLISRQPLISDAIRNIYDIGPDVQITIEESLRFYPPEYRSKLNPALEQASKEGKPFHLELQLVSARGKTKWVKVTCNPLTVEGRTVRLYGTLQDITKEKDQHLRITASEHRYKTLAENLPNGAIFTIDSDYNFKFIAGTELKKLGTPPSFFEGKNIALFNSPHQLELMKKNYSSVFEGATRSFEVEYNDNRYLLSAMPLADETGDIKEIMIVSQNITEKYEAERERERQHDFLRQLIDASPNMILVKDKEGRFVLANKAFAAFYNTTVEDIVGKTNRELGQHSEAQIRRYAAEDREIFQRTQSKIAIEENAVSIDGTEYWFKTVKTPVISEKGTVDQVLMVCADITEQKQALQKEKILNESLTKTNAELDQFVYTTSHNLRAPLTSILGIIHILKSDGEVREHTALIQLIEKSIHQLDATIQEITDYARNNRIEVAVEPIHFEKIIADTLESLKFMEGAAQISIQYEVDPDLEFNSDARRLKMIFNNLLSNAIKYQNFKITQPRINIGVKPLGKNVIINIHDNGIGIRADQQDKIFQMFYRATDRSTGAGLGLYIVKEILDKLKGTISVDTTYGEGTVFTLKIPNLCQSEPVSLKNVNHTGA